MIILAGSETSSVGLAPATYHLLKNTDVLDKLAREIWHAFATEDKTNILAVNQLPYLSTVLQETLRISPPRVIGFPREVPMPEAMIDGHWIPSSVSPCINNYLMQRIC